MLFLMCISLSSRLLGCRLIVCVNLSLVVFVLLFDVVLMVGEVWLRGWCGNADRALHLAAMHSLPTGGDGALPAVKVERSNIGLLMQ